ncbi:glycoside hydrolase family 16 protein [Tricladium varicosporioides]|nr:glycoside hydrolase family 16 protein [Hymenoscyphus varicosporioides]
MRAIVFLLAPLFTSATSAYTLVHNYDHTNWYSSFNFKNGPDPTKGTVEYINLAEAQFTGLTRIINNQVYLGVDNTTNIPAASQAGRKSIWLTSRDTFKHGILIGDFAHVPGSICGIWPGFWTIREQVGQPYAEIDILESFNDNTFAYSTLHTSTLCSFNAPPSSYFGTLNEGFTNCTLGTPGCSAKGNEGSYGDGFNRGGGGVYALHWTNAFLRIYFWPRNLVPRDITAGFPRPEQWGLPVANFDGYAPGSACNIEKSFPSEQTIYFDTTFCGAMAGGKGWSDWSDCKAKTGVNTCEEYVRTRPGDFDEAYWLVNSVKIYQ